MKDTVGDFDDMANAFPQWSKVPLVAQTDLITLHEPHIYNWYTDISLRLCYWYSSWKILYITIQIPNCKNKKNKNNSNWGKPNKHTQTCNKINKIMQDQGGCVQYWWLMGDGNGFYLHHTATGRRSKSENYHLNPSWAVWNKQSAFYSIPGPTWLLCCLGSATEK